MTFAAMVLFWVVSSCVVLALGFRRAIKSAWCEPVLRAPVLILESDDWGYGPVEQAEALHRVGDLLAGYRDRTGRHPVMTLGVVLAGPDTATMRSEGGERYRRLTLTDDPLVPLRDAIVYHVLNEVVENNNYRGTNVDPIADLLVFNPLGILLFSNESVTRFFANTLQLRDWSYVPALNPFTGTLENYGQNFSIKWR